MTPSLIELATPLSAVTDACLQFDVRAIYGHVRKLTKTKTPEIRIFVYIKHTYIHARNLAHTTTYCIHMCLHKNRNNSMF